MLLSTSSAMALAIVYSVTPERVIISSLGVIVTVCSCGAPKTCAAQLISPATPVTERKQRRTFIVNPNPQMNHRQVLGSLQKRFIFLFCTDLLFVPSKTYS